jgi:hypothetical protein
MIQTLAELFAQTQRSVTHLEMRDTYGTGAPGLQAWLKGMDVEESAQLGNTADWVSLVSQHTSRGVSFRRARIISEPVTDYIRWEHGVTPACNLAGGEEVRWLPRPQARDLALPGCDFWQFDDGLVCWVYQSGDGEKAGYDLSETPAEVQLCSAAFEAVWSRAIDHAEYRPA